MADPQREGRQLHRYRGKIAALKRLLADVRTVMQSAHGAGATGQEIDAKTRAWLTEVDAALRGELKEGPAPLIKLIVRPMLVCGQLATDPDGLVILIDSEQSEHEQVVTLWHEVLHALGLTDEDQVDAIALGLADANPAILRTLAQRINLPNR